MGDIQMCYERRRCVPTETPGWQPKYRHAVGTVVKVVGSKDRAKILRHVGNEEYDCVSLTGESIGSGIRLSVNRQGYGRAVVWRTGLELAAKLAGVDPQSYGDARRRARSRALKDARMAESSVSGRGPQFRYDPPR